MIDKRHIQERLGVTMQQVEVAIYSGALPRPNEAGLWDAEYVEFFLRNWEERIERQLNSKRPLPVNCVTTFL